MRTLVVPGLALLLGCGPKAATPPCQPVTVPAPPAPSALAAPFVAWAGRARPLVGLSAGDAAARAAPYDFRYLYLAGGLADGAGPCASCATGCSSQGTSCASSGPGCAWWGCWQWDRDPPGAYARAFLQRARADGQIPMFTYYLLLPASGLPEGTAEVAAVADTAFLARYLADWRFLLRQIGGEKAILHLEPDFWGYAQKVNLDPSAIPAAVRAAAPADCGAGPDTLAGLVRCMIGMARALAPNATVGLHASGWAPTYDCFDNTTCPDPAAEGARSGAWLRAAGADAGDFVASDMSDRDAGWYAAQCAPADAACREVHGWTSANFDRTFAWARAAAEQVGRPVLWWQTPVGNSLQDDTTGHWKDDRVETLFARMGDLAAAHGAGVAFGAGASGQTTPETDGGLLASSTALYAAGGGARACR